jgi:hypothetical protein
VHTRIVAALASLVSGAVPALAQEITTPEAHLGRPVGVDFELADWGEVSSYHELLAGQSPRVRAETVGTTTEGRDFLLVTISSEENLANLEELRAAARRLADPRGLGAAEREALLERAKPFLFVSIAMHSTETAAPQFGMELAHRLATSEEEPYASAREELVVLLAPCLNPDGLDHVVSWYRETVGTPYEGTGLLQLYQHYAGHDNNRDWFMLSQAETRIVTRLLYSEWFPQVYWDVHQQGSSRERFFVPPFRDPLNPNLDPGVIAGIGQLGTRALFDMTREGFSGVSTGVTYDMWWNGGNRNVPVRHNVIGLLTEAASVNVASPMFLRKRDLSAPGGSTGLSDYAPSNRFPDPWPGGWWRLRDIIDYEHAFARSLFASLAREPRLWLANALAAAERAIEAGDDDAPRSWVVPSTNADRGATRRLIDSLLRGGVELGVAEASFEADGRTWPAGSIVIQRRQPYGQHVKDLFEVQRYPDGDPPYDVAGWTLPLLLGVHRVEVMEAVEAPVRPVTSAEDAVAAFPSGVGDDRASAADSDGWVAVFRRLAAGEPVTFLSGGDDAGTFLFTDEAPAGAGDGDEQETSDAPDLSPLTIRSMPRVGLYSPWSGSMDEGWARFVFDSFGLPYVSVRNEMIRAGELASFLDVLVVASISGGYLEEGRDEGSVPPEYARGLAPEGAAAIEAFVRAGGRLVTIDRSARWAVELFDLPLVDVTRGEEASEFSCPGSVLRSVPEEHALTAGLPGSVSVFFSRSAAWELAEDAEEEDRERLETLLSYAPTHVLSSGWIRAPDTIAGKAAWMRAAHGKGSVDLFAFRPQYRGWSQGTFQLLFRALLFAR